MSTQIKCPYCKKLFEPGDAFKHDFEEQIAKLKQRANRPTGSEPAGL